MTRKMGELLKKYGLFGVMQLMFYRLHTLIFFPGARLIRLPFEIRNRRHISVGERFTTGKYCRLEAYPSSGLSGKILLIGKDVQINDNVHIVAVQHVNIGDHVLIASKVFISDSNHGSYSGSIQSSPEEPPAQRPLSVRPVNIGNNVWIGEFVTILPGVTIGAGAVIGSMSVVSRDIPGNCIAVGIPAKVIKRYSSETAKWEKV